MADQGNSLTRLSDKADIGQHRAAWFIGETDLAEFHFTGNRRQRPGGGGVGPFGWAIDQAEKAFRASHSTKGLVILVADDLDGVKEEVRQEKEHHEVTHLHVA